MQNTTRNYKTNLYVPWSKFAILGMVIPPFNRNPYNGYINPYYWVDDHPLLYGNNGSLEAHIVKLNVSFAVFLKAQKLQKLDFLSTQHCHQSEALRCWSNRSR